MPPDESVVVLDVTSTSGADLPTRTLTAAELAAGPTRFALAFELARVTFGIQAQGILHRPRRRPGPDVGGHRPGVRPTRIRSMR